jgi:hypothetical protein
MRALIAGLTALAMLAGSIPAEARSERGPKPRVAEVPPPRVKIPPGELHIIVSLNDQRVSVYSNGVLAARSGVSTGTASNPTPMGIFAVIQKRRFHRSNLYSNAPMPFMQRLTWSGVALHAGLLPGYPASHGCIRLPEEFAELLWTTTKAGARVIVARDDVAPHPIAHPSLLTPRLQEPEALIGVMMPLGDIKSEDAQKDLTLKDGRIQMASTESVISDAPKAADPSKQKALAPVSVFVSRKDKRLYVRQAFEPLFEMPAAIRDDQAPVGTHVFTAIDFNGDRSAMRWVAVTMPGEPAKIERRPKETKAAFDERREREMKAARTAGPLPSPQTAAQALDRLELSKEARERIADLLVPGSALIISDHALHYETGEGTEFVVRTH